MGGQVVEDHDIALVQCWGELGFDILQESIAIHGAIDHPWRCQTVMAQAGNESQGFPVAMGNTGDQPLASFCPSSKTSHFGVQSGFVNEHDLAEFVRVGFQPGLTFTPDGTRRLYIAASLLGGVCGFFYR